MIYSDTNNKDNVGHLNIVIWWPPAFGLDFWWYRGRLTENESNKSILAGEQTKKYWSLVNHPVMVVNYLIHALIQKKSKSNK